MERLFSKRIEMLRSAEGDPMERKRLISCLLRFRRLFLWAALPLLLGLLALAGTLLSFYMMVMRGKMPATLFLKVADIFSVYTGLVALTGFACLYFVKASDEKLSLLSSLRPDDEVAIEPTDPCPVHSENKLEPNDGNASRPLPETDGEAISSPPESDPDRRLVSSPAVYENVE